jgi:hypothetical protein
MFLRFCVFLAHAVAFAFIDVLSYAVFPLDQYLFTLQIRSLTTRCVHCVKSSAHFTLVSSLWCPRALCLCPSALCLLLSALTSLCPLFADTKAYCRACKQQPGLWKQSQLSHPTRCSAETLLTLPSSTEAPVKSKVSC